MVGGSDDSEELTGIGAEFPERRGSERELDCYRKALVVIRPKHSCARCVCHPFGRNVTPRAV